MRAFLSHSGYDKGLVQKVFDILGAGQAIYDSDSFRTGSTAQQEMTTLLSTTDLFVLFWSKHAAAAEGVTFELDHMRLESQRRELPLLIISIDGEPYSSLPKWMRHYIVENLTAAPVIARRIQAKLITLRSNAGLDDVFVNRTRELEDIESRLAAPTDEMPIAFALCGWRGIGRRTLAKRAIKNIFPASQEPFPIAALQGAEGPLDFHRKLVDLTEKPKISQWLEIAEEFQAASRSQQVEQLVERVQLLRNARELLLLVDEGGIVADNNKYHTWFSLFLKEIPRDSRPALALIQHRASSRINQESHPMVAFFRIGSLDDSHSQSLLSLLFKQLNLRFGREQLKDLSHFIGGHPGDLQQAAKFAQREGVEALSRDKSVFRMATAKHSIDILARLGLDLPQTLVATTVRDFSLVSTEDLLELMGQTPAKVIEELGGEPQWSDVIETLENYSILERWGEYLRLAPFLADAFSRYSMSKPARTRKLVATALPAYGEAMIHIANTRSITGRIELATIESGLLASLRASNRSEWFRQLVLPSHLLGIARECYDKNEYSRSVQLAEEALTRKHALTGDAQCEANRLLAMALIRQGKLKDADRPLQALLAIGSNVSKRNAHFIRGFRSRINGDIDRAEEEYRLSLGFGNRNLHTLRELAYVLLVQRRYQEAERFARSAYGIAPSNPFVLDILCAVLIGKPRDPLLLQEDPELAGRLAELETQDDLQGTSFHQPRWSQFYSVVGQDRLAMELASKAVRTRGRRATIPTRLVLVECAISSGSIDIARRELGAAKRQANEVKTGDRSHWPQIVELEILLSLESGDLNGAIRTLKESHSLPNNLRKRLADRAATVHSERPSSELEPSLRDWLKRSHTSGTSMENSFPRKKGVKRDTMGPKVASLRASQVVLGRIIDRKHGMYFIDIHGFQALVPKRLVNDRLKNAPNGEELSFEVHSIDTQKPSLILRPIP